MRSWLILSRPNPHINKRIHTHIMGYTHYWELHPQATADHKLLENQFITCTQCLRTAYNYLQSNPFAHRGCHEGIYDSMPCTIRGGLGEGEPIFFDTIIQFNGDMEKEMNHDTFHINLDTRAGFGFCKTARKPYDILVRYALLILKQTLGKDVFSFTSDGKKEEWRCWPSDWPGLIDIQESTYG